MHVGAWPWGQPTHHANILIMGIQGHAHGGMHSPPGPPGPTLRPSPPRPSKIMFTPRAGHTSICGAGGLLDFEETYYQKEGKKREDLAGELRGCRGGRGGAEGDGGILKYFTPYILHLPIPKAARHQFEAHKSNRAEGLHGRPIQGQPTKCMACKPGLRSLIHQTQGSVLFTRHKDRFCTEFED